MKKLLTMKKIFIMLALVFALSALFTACGKADGTKDTNPSNDGAQAEGSINVIGSTSVEPIANMLAEAYIETNPDAEIPVQGIGSSEGIKAVNEGTADIGTSSRELKDEEKAWGLTEHVIALDGIAVIVNPSNGISDLTKDQIAKVFKGEIKNWKEIGGDDKEIVVFNREAGSGTRGAFEELLKLEEKQPDGTKKSLIRDDALVMESTGGIKTSVASNDAAIGYISLGVLDNTVKALKVDGIEATVDNVKAETYTVFRPFLMVTKGEPKPLAKAFIDYILSADGQKIVEEEKFIPVK